jgi:hypothetical protein
MNDPHAALDEKRIQEIDLFLRSGAKAKVMEPNAPLIEIVFSIRFRRTSDSDRRSPSNHVQAIRSLHNRLHAHETQHVFIERHGPLEIINRELYVSDSIDLDHWALLPRLRVRLTASSNRPDRWPNTIHVRFRR